MFDPIARTRDNFQRQVVMTTLAGKMTVAQKGTVTLEMPFDSKFTQQHGFLHAGIVTTMLDSACGYAAFTMMPEDAEVLTVEFKSNFLNPARGEVFRFVGDVLKPGRQLIITRGTAYACSVGQPDVAISAMQATMMVIRDRAGVNG